jgi:hypothetical protein
LPSDRKDVEAVPLLENTSWQHAPGDGTLPDQKNSMLPVVWRE